MLCNEYFATATHNQKQNKEIPVISPVNFGLVWEDTNTKRMDIFSTDSRRLVQKNLLITPDGMNYFPSVFSIFLAFWRNIWRENNILQVIVVASSGIFTDLCFFWKETRKTKTLEYNGDIKRDLSVSAFHFNCIYFFLHYEFQYAKGDLMCDCLWESNPKHGNHNLLPDALRQVIKDHQNKMWWYLNITTIVCKTIYT